jgi:TPP-dependent pyruvate/acetoin dehydrogenase alpha subunit
VAWLEDNEVLDDEGLQEIRGRVKEEVERAVEFAEASARPEPDAFLSKVYAEEYPGFDVRAGR